MVESAVIFLLEKLKHLVTTEVNLLSDVRAEVECIKDKLELMQAFLRVADAMEENDSMLKVWVKQVRVVACDIEDVVDEFKLSLAHQHVHGFYASLHRIYCSLKNLKTRHRIDSEIQIIKSRMRSISEEYNKYQGIASEKGSSSAGPSITRVSSQADALFLGKADHLVGINKPKIQLIEWLVRSDAKRTVVSVVGMGGLGKTTLVKQVYEDAVVKKHFKIHAWLTASQSFKVEELLRDMVRKLFSVKRIPIPQAVDSMDSDELPEIIDRLLRRSRYLIVLDDVWRLNAWNAIKHVLPDNNRGSRIMLTTRHLEVATASKVESNGEIYTLEPLPDEESWDLFCKKSFKGMSCPDHLENFCRVIVKKCGGLPLAIVAISGVLSRKETGNIDEWEMVCRSLISQIEDNDNLDGLRKVFSLSFNDLPYYLKSCFLYLSIFPEDHLIHHNRLIRLWVAEGFVQAQERKTPEEVAEGYLKELTNRSLIQVAETGSDGRSKTYRIHDLLREFIVSKSRDQSFVTIARGQHGMTWPEKVRRLSVQNKLELVQISKVNFRLRSFMIFGVEDSLPNFSIKKLVGGNSRLLTVLDLQAAPLEKFPDDIVEFFHLKYLSLRNTQVKEIPSSIGKLQNLETLDLKHTEVSEVPAQILKLGKLRHLLVCRYNYESYAHSKSGFKASKALEKIGRLHSLQKLCFIEANQNSNTIMREVGKLNELRKLGIIKLKREDGNLLCSVIEKLTNLRSLSITSTEESKIIDMDELASPPQYLQRLYLTGRLEKVPHWISSLRSLVRVYLRSSQLKDDPLPDLENLPNLVHLDFLQVCDSEILRFRAGKFQSLKLLGLDKLDKLEEIIVEEGAMPCLEKLIIQRCNLLHRVPMGIEGLSQLKVLSFFDMPDQLIDTLRPDRAQDYCKVQHVPEIYSTYWNDQFGSWDVYSLENSLSGGVNTPTPIPLMRIHGRRKGNVWKQ